MVWPMGAGAVMSWLDCDSDCDDAEHWIVDRTGHTDERRWKTVSDVWQVSVRRTTVVEEHHPALGKTAATEMADYFGIQSGYGQLPPGASGTMRTAEAYLIDGEEYGVRRVTTTVGAWSAYAVGRY